MTLEELEKRVGILEDREEIMNLQKQYMYWLDSYDFNKIVDSFTEDAVVEIRNEAPRQGKKEITDLKVYPIKPPAGVGTCEMGAGKE